MKGGRRQGGQRKRWEDNIREWTGLEFAKSQRAVENRKRWRKLVAKSSDETFSNTCFIYSKTIFKTGYKREKCKCSFRYES